MNLVIISGNLGADPEIRATQSGSAVGNIRVATKERRKKGEAWEDHTEWHRVVLFGKDAENVGKHFKKGDGIVIEGKISTSKYTDKQGVEKYSTEIICNRWEFGIGKAGGGGDRAPSSGGGQYGGDTRGGYGGAGGNSGGGAPPDDDSIPF